MKIIKSVRMTTVFFALLLYVSVAFAQSASEFAKPGQGNHPWVYWFWNNGNLTKEGIDADLEAMHRVGIGGVLIMEVGQGAPRGPVDFMSDQWRELFKYVISKATSLNMEVNMYNGPGWSGSGGPWITPENAMKVLSIGIVEVPAENRPEKIVVPTGTITFDYYRDICVLAFPTPEVKTDLGFLNVDNQRLKNPAHQIPAEAFIPLDDVLDISGKMNDAGEILEALPAGNWTLIRFGMTCKRMNTHPTPVSAAGHECDRLSKRGIEAAFDGQIRKLIADNRESIGTTFVATHIDSWENGSQTWTDDMREEFLTRRQYDVLKFLPIFAGYVMENPEYTERFLWDFRRTVSELVLENYAGRMKELAGENGLRFTAEAYYGTPADNLQYAGITDEPMGEFWGITRMLLHTCRGMASAAHIYGKRIIGAEAFTANEVERWLAHPGSMKAVGDMAFSEGINRFAFHRYSFQPWENVRPGMTMGHWGSHYERTQTWWELTPTWHEYLSRCQYLLRQGEFVADILYVEPEDSPQQLTDHPRNGFQWDQGNTDVILKSTVENGWLVLESGMKYRVLVLPPTNRMTPELLEKILQLAHGGLTVIGEYRATAAPGLTDYPNNDRHVKELAQALWSDSKTPDDEPIANIIKNLLPQRPEAWSDIKTQSGEHIVGKGKVLWGVTPEAVLTGMNLVPAFASDIRLNWIHRRLPDSEIYFIANPRNQTVLANIQLRGKGKPELWYPETGENIQAAVFQTDDKTTRLTLPLRATESVFVILRPLSDDNSRSNSNKLSRLVKDGKQLFDLNEPPNKIIVTSARYGILTDPSKTVDVKPLVEKIIDGGEWRIPVGRMVEQQGNPASNAVKTLVIDYEMDGKRHTVTGKDAETVVLGTMLPPVKILNATSESRESQMIDIPERLQNYFDRGENHFAVSWLTRPDDPAPMRFWGLKFEYAIDDKTKTWSGHSWYSSDGTMISLEGKIDIPAAIPIHNYAGSPCIDFYESGKYELFFTSNKKRTQIVTLPEPLILDSNWDVAFPHKTVTFDRLMSWSESVDDSIKFFSGTATYTKMFTVPKNLLKKGMRIVLDSGQTEIIAQLELNGKNLGVLWKVEKTVDITDFLITGENRLTISVTNLLPNRMIGDARLPASDDRNANGSLKALPQWLLDGKPDPNGRSTFSMWNLWKADDEPIPSGLIGPVLLRPVKRVVVD